MVVHAQPCPHPGHCVTSFGNFVGSNPLACLLGQQCNGILNGEVPGLHSVDGCVADLSRSKLSY